MTPEEQAKYIGLLIDAERQYKLAIAVSAARRSSKDNVFNYLSMFTYGRHGATHDELYLNPEQEKRAASALEHCAINLMAVQIDTVLSHVVSDRFNHSDTSICSASWIARLIRNAFAHNPLNPIWLTYSECDNREFTVTNIIRLHTTGLHSKRLNRRDYGGPLSLLRLSEFVRATVSSITTT